MANNSNRLRKNAAQRQTIWSTAFALAILTVDTSAWATELAYGGRLVDARGVPLAGPVDITLRFFGSINGIDQLGTDKSFPGVALDGGVFQISVNLEAADETAIFGDGASPVFVEVESAGKVYPRQRFAPVPLALRIPVDNDTLVYGPNAKLTVGEIALDKVQGLATLLAEKLDVTSGTSNLETGSWQSRYRNNSAGRSARRERQIDRSQWRQRRHRHHESRTPSSCLSV